MFHDLHIAGINYESVVDGPGVRTAIFFSGCTHHCPGCHNPATQDPNYGKLADLNDVLLIANEINKRPYIQGITLTGGDPFCSSGVWAFVAILLHYIDRHLDVWAYTGSHYDEVKDSPLLVLTDVLVDGPYIESLRDPSLAFRGSSNQRIIDVRATQKAGEIVLYDLKGNQL